MIFSAPKLPSHPHLPPPSTARRHATIAAVSFALWSLWAVNGPTHPYGDLSNGVFTDHFSHMNVARLFTRVGTEIWRQPINRLLRPVAPEERKDLPADFMPLVRHSNEVYRVPEWPIDKPVAAGWSGYPRMYPPGHMLLVAPVALVYHFTGLSFTGANRVLIVLFLAFAHVSLFFLLESMAGRGASPIQLIVLFLLYFEMVHWAIEGFFDVAAMAPLIACAVFLRDKRGLAAAVAFCAAAALHFRAYFFAPWAVYAAWLVVRQKEWTRWKQPHLAAVGAAAVMAIASLYAFFLLWPTLTTLPDGNALSSIASRGSHGAQVAFVFVLVAVGAVLVYAKAWLDVAVLLWLGVMLASLRQTYPWHSVVALLPWLAAPLSAPTGPRAALARDARLAFVLFAIALVFKHNPAPTWLSQVL